MSETTLTVSGMTCRNCAQRVTRALSGLGGVHEVEVDLGEGTVFVGHVPGLPPEVLAATVSAVGYPSQLPAVTVQTANPTEGELEAR